MARQDTENSPQIDEIDLRIINALQWEPRSTWLALARALGLDAATVARRWARLTEERLAWVTITPGPRVLDLISTALLEVDCAPSLHAAVADRLCSLPHAATVETLSSRASVLATVGAPSYAALVRIVDEVRAIEGVHAVRTGVVTEWFAQGGDWRLDALAPDERDRTRAPARPRQQPVPALTDEDRQVLAILARDGRTPMRALAASVGAAPQVLARRLDRLLSSDLIGMRCEFARPAAGFPILATLWCRVPAVDVAAAGRHAARLPEVRTCVAVVGADDLVVQLWLHAPSALADVETRLHSEHPALTVTDRAVDLRLHKLFGSLLDDGGRRTGTIAPDVWAP
ncbi:Lrp/AsnC family transcriptional regulator [Rhodococcus rhodnii]|uniref:AsnC family transcriptional regulator n=1 Tax=Rhodococcus rhodnii LMG 5362 TaxID=1273125 RepID=R7WWI5_9NOCA|nr:Lrp/AsnC family transcriptional regulator [Rhodococcus rhodnii]EOM78499.1 AsnC family transcriptional regulator [Rhodococcus rhodnii LMG 5362]